MKQMFVPQSSLSTVMMLEHYVLMTIFPLLNYHLITVMIINAPPSSRLPSCHRGLPGSLAEAKGGRLPAERQDRRPLHQSGQGLRRRRRDLPQSAGAAAAAGRSHQVGYAQLATKRTQRFLRGRRRRRVLVLFILF